MSDCHGSFAKSQSCQTIIGRSFVLVTTFRFACQGLVVRSPWCRKARLEILRRNEQLHVSHFSLLSFPDFRRLLTGQLLSQSADAMTSLVIASAVLFSSKDGPTTELLMQAVISAAIPLFLGGPLGGFMADRWPRHRLLVLGQIVRSLLVAATVLSIVVDSTPMLLTCFIALQCLARVLYTARAAAVRHVVRQHELIVADSTVLITGVVAGLVGVALAMAVLQVHSVAALILASVLHFIAAYRYDAIRAWIGGNGKSPTLKWRFAFAQFKCGKTRYSLLATSAHRFGIGVALASTALFLDDDLGRGASGYGMALGAAGIGSFIGSIAAEALNERLPHKSLTVASYLVAGAAMIIATVLGSSLVMLVGTGLAAMAFQVLRIASDATIQANALKGSCGRVFAVYDIMFNSSFLAGLLAGLHLSDGTSPQATIMLTVFYFPIAAVIFALMPRAKTTLGDVRGSGHPTTRKRTLVRPLLE